MYIYELSTWPNFTWEAKRISAPLKLVQKMQRQLLAHMASLGFAQQREAELDTLTLDVLKSSEIEGETLDTQEVRSSIARRLGIESVSATHKDRDVEGMVEMMINATLHYDFPLSQERLFAWHDGLFPKGKSGSVAIDVGKWRDDHSGPMQVVSGPFGREKIYFEAPPAPQLDPEMMRFLDWVNQDQKLDPILKAAIAHLWFVTIHPFDDGNGRIARAIADMLLARSEKSAQRFYSMSSQIRLERTQYYLILEKTQKSSLDITEWLLWFFTCLQHAIADAEQNLQSILKRARYWRHFFDQNINERQKKMLTMLLDNFEGKLTVSKWAKICKCPEEIAQQDIADLIKRGMLMKDLGDEHSVSYVV